ncbi:hypothetical protein BJV82DRAFT_668248 [Fennellomyces sp. T-0311]|nr:hypothetical protein BJV82DRAFT_668248 [Fennellomyces sp. T-0311]
MNSEWEEPRFNPKQLEECQAKVAKYEALIQNHEASFNARKEAVQRDAETSKRKRADAQRVLREEIAKLEQCIREHQEKLPETQERTRQLAEQVDASRTQYHEALAQKKSIQKTRDHLAASIERKKAEKQSRTAEAGRHLDRSQLDATRNAAKLTISGQGGMAAHSTSSWHILM